MYEILWPSERCLLTKKLTEIYLGRSTQKYNKDDKETASSCHVTYAIQSESTLCSCLNVKETIVENRRDI